jgi:hypothetical protein
VLCWVISRLIILGVPSDCAPLVILLIWLTVQRETTGVRLLGLLHPIFSVLSPAIPVLCISEEYASPRRFLVATTLEEKR